MFFHRSRSWLWLTAAGYFVVLGYLTLAPDPWWIFGEWGGTAEETLESTLDDFIQHGVAYALLAVLLTIAAASTRRPSFATCGLIAACHAVLTESMQYWIPLRVFDMFDLVANVAGVVLGLGATTALFRFVRHATDDSTAKTISPAQSTL